jgi:hypothetical protein
MAKKRVYRRVTDKERKQMEQLRKAGWSDAEIGRRLRRNRQTVNRVLGPSGCPPGPVPVTTPGEVASLARRRVRDEEIARKFKLSEVWVSRLRNLGGIKYPAGVKAPKKK